MKICVTGGAGFIGSNLVTQLVKEDHEVVVVDNLSTGYLKNLDHVIDKIKFIEGDAGDQELMLKVLNGVDAVSHQAALASVPRSIKDPLLTHQQTLTASLVTLECSRLCKVKRFVYAASSSAYGNRTETYKIESMTPIPISPYAASKVAVEMYAHAYSHSFGMETIGLRYFNVFGPRQDPFSDYAAVIPRFIKRIRNNQAPIITGDGDQSRDFTYVSNVVQANISAMTAKEIPPGSVINIASGRKITLPDLVKQLNIIAKTNFEPEFSDPRPGDIRHSLADISCAKETIGYVPTISFEEGLQKTWDYAHKNWDT